MPNKSGNAYGLTTLCPLLATDGRGKSPAIVVRDRLGDTPTDEHSPMAGVPNTYFCRFFVLSDVVYESKPARLEHLKSRYLVFTSNFHGELERYLSGMWEHAEQFVRHIFEYGVGFESVCDSASFIEYIKRCQVETTFYFNGSTDEPLAEQLKALYLKQELSKFAYEHQGQKPEKLQEAFAEFIERVKPFETSGPSWRPGASTLQGAVVGS